MPFSLPILLSPLLALAYTPSQYGPDARRCLERYHQKLRAGSLAPSIPLTCKNKALGLAKAAVDKVDAFTPKRDPEIDATLASFRAKQSAGAAMGCPELKELYRFADETGFERSLQQEMDTGDLTPSTLSRERKQLLTLRSREDRDWASAERAAEFRRRYDQTFSACGNERAPYVESFERCLEENVVLPLTRRTNEMIQQRDAIGAVAKRLNCNVVWR